MIAEESMAKRKKWSHPWVFHHFNPPQVTPTSTEPVTDVSARRSAVGRGGFLSVGEGVGPTRYGTFFS